MEVREEMPLAMDSEMLKLFRSVKEMGACMAIIRRTIGIRRHGGQ